MEGSASAARPGGIVTVLAVAGIVAAIMMTLVVPLIGDLPRLLDTTASTATWVVTATLLSSAVTTPVTGRLGDLYGKRRMLLVCAVPLAAGSVVCALASSVVPMIVGRSLQGMGMGMIPLGVSAMRDLLPTERLGSSIALMSSSMGVGAALGLPLSAAVSENTSWRVMFWAVGALSVLIAVLVRLLVPAIPVSHPGARFDAVGALGLGAALVCLLLALSKGADWGWGSGITLGLFAAGVVALVAWGWWELRTRDPLVDLRVTARRQVLLTNAASLAVGVAMYTQALSVPQLRQLPEATGYGLGQSMLTMGLWMAPGGLTMMAVSPLGARLSAAYGPRNTLLTGSLVIALGYGSSTVLLGSTWGLLVLTCICSTGVGLAYGAMPALIMSAVPQSETASANSFNTLMRAIGTSVSAAVVGVVLSQMSMSPGDRALPSENGFRAALLIGCGVALVAAAITLAIPGREAAASRGGPGLAEGAGPDGLHGGFGVTRIP